MKIKTSELSGASLDWAVAKCEDMQEGVVRGKGVVKSNGLWTKATETGSQTAYLLRSAHDTWVKQCEDYPWWRGQRIWEPTRNWSQGGSIIEREGISLEYRSCIHEPELRWSASVADNTEEYSATAITPLIAAMRCYVASKLGDEVDIPEELW